VGIFFFLGEWPGYPLNFTLRLFSFCQVVNSGLLRSALSLPQKLRAAAFSTAAIPIAKQEQPADYNTLKVY